MSTSSFNSRHNFSAEFRLRKKRQDVRKGRALNFKRGRNDIAQNIFQARPPAVLVEFAEYRNNTRGNQVFMLFMCISKHLRQKDERSKRLLNEEPHHSSFFWEYNQESSRKDSVRDQQSQPRGLFRMSSNCHIGNEGRLPGSRFSDNRNMFPAVRS